MKSYLECLIKTKGFSVHNDLIKKKSSMEDFFKEIFNGRKEDCICVLDGRSSNYLIELV